jgi:recombination protein RecR
MYPESIQKIISLFLKFPTVGARTATRFSFYLAKQDKKETKELLEAIIEMKSKIKTCPLCFNVFQTNQEICEICSDSSRNKNLLCVVEKETDLESIEEIKKYKGFYFVLGGTLSPLRKDSIKKIRGKELLEKLKDPENSFQEVIIATNFTPQGEVTALYLERIIKPLKIKTTKLAKGLPTGSELEYIDEETLSSALEGRK